MFTAKQYRAKAAEYTELVKAARLPAEIRELQKLEQSFLTLAENEEWMADNREKTINPGADDNCYGDVLLPRRREECSWKPWGDRPHSVDRYPTQDSAAL